MLPHNVVVWRKLLVLHHVINLCICPGQIPLHKAIVPTWSDACAGLLAKLNIAADVGEMERFCLRPSEMRRSLTWQTAEWLPITQHITSSVLRPSLDDYKQNSLESSPWKLCSEERNEPHLPWSNIFISHISAVVLGALHHSHLTRSKKRTRRIIKSLFRNNLWSAKMSNVARPFKKRMTPHHVLEAHLNLRHF